MPRRALLVADAIGPEATAQAVLKRFGFGASVTAPSLDAALEQLRDASYDLLVAPLQHVTAPQLAMLQRLMQQQRATFVIGTAPSPDSELILRAMRAGIHEFVVHPPDPTELTAALDRLMRRAPAESQRGQVIAVYASKGGLGTTSVAVNLAFGLARNNPEARVALGDLVVAGGDVRVFLNLAASYHMGHLVEKLERADAELLYALLTPTDRGVWVLPSPDNPELDEEIDAATIGTMVDHLRASFAYTVLDCEHHLSERTLAAFDAADRLVLLTQLNVPALRSTQRTIQLCRRLGFSSDKLCVVVTRAQASDVLSNEDAEEVLTAAVYGTLPNDYVRSSEALTHGAPLVELFGDAELSRAYLRLAARLGGVAAPRGPALSAGADASPSRLGRLLGLVRRA